MTTKSNRNKKVLVALSGGVDSGVSAALLKEQGYTVEAAHMVCWNEGPYCTSDQDRSSAAKVSAYLSIPFQVFDFRQEYKNAVINYFFSEYEAGRTPNPDVACNKEIKFGIFLKKAMDLGFDYIATGHYARIQKLELGSQNLREKEGLKTHNNEQSLEQFKLLAGVDHSKDQSYFLYNLTQEQLKHTLFPIGCLLKSEVRRIAQNLKLPNAKRKDSQGICFIGDVEIREFLRSRVKTRIGNIITTKGEVIGKHQGVAFYTIGQREGLQTGKNIPYYVVEKRKLTNSLIVAPLGDSSHFKNKLSAQNVNWVTSFPTQGQSVKVRIRYRQELVEGKLNNVKQNSFKLSFYDSQRAITSGQAAVIYSGDQVLGGGIIS